MTEKIDRDIDRLFSDELLPLAGRLKGADAALLRTRLEPAGTSYFVQRPRAAMAKADFESGGCASPEGAEADLAALWGAGEDRSLAALAPGMARLARALRQVEEESGEVSNFVYVMY